MPEIRALTVAVGGWYARTLAICLPRNAHHFAEIYVITTAEDKAVHAVVESVPNARLSVTDAFTRHHASFNKGLAIEEAGFDFMGRHGWLCVLDSDILLPPTLPIHDLPPGKLYGAKRRLLENPADWYPEPNWRKARSTNDGNAPIGFFQLFHADDPAIKDKRPWYSVNYPHAGGCDAFFLEHWPSHARKVLPVTTIHLGPRDRHWWGDSPEAVDKMAAFVHQQRWARAMREHDPKAVERVGELPERVDVPGYELSSYQMPFERRAKARRRPSE